jgi:hypothetical protein
MTPRNSMPRSLPQLGGGGNPIEGSLAPSPHEELNPQRNGSLWPHPVGSDPLATDELSVPLAERVRGHQRGHSLSGWSEPLLHAQDDPLFWSYLWAADLTAQYGDLLARNEQSMSLDREERRANNTSRNICRLRRVTRPTSMDKVCFARGAKEISMVLAGQGMGAAVRPFTYFAIRNHSACAHYGD